MLSTEVGRNIWSLHRSPSGERFLNSASSRQYHLPIPTRLCKAQHGCAPGRRGIRIEAALATNAKAHHGLLVPFSHPGSPKRVIRLR